MSAYGVYGSGGQPQDPPPDPPGEVMEILAAAFAGLPEGTQTELLRRFRREPPPPPPARPVFLAEGAAPGASPQGGLLYTGTDGNLYYLSPRGCETQLTEGG